MGRRMPYAVLLGALALGACDEQLPEAGAPDIDPLNLDIEVGRYGVMIDQGMAARNFLEEKGAAGDPSEEVDGLALERSIHIRALEANLLQAEVCAKELVPQTLCAAPFTPAWLSEPRAESPTLWQLQARADQLGAFLMPIWGALCEKAKGEGADEVFCAIE